MPRIVDENVLSVIPFRFPAFFINTACLDTAANIMYSYLNVLFVDFLV